MAKNENRQFVGLSCTVCGNQRRLTSKNKANTPDKLELNKYCRVCRKNTLHKESKVTKS